MLKLNWLKIFLLALIQCLAGYLIFILYLLFTWIVFGEGSNSLLYTSGNRIIWAISPAIGATILNSYRIFQGIETANRRKKSNYIVIQSIFFVSYVIFTIIQFSHNRYRI